jgi:hypothetical protein
VDAPAAARQESSFALVSAANLPTPEQKNGFSALPEAKIRKPCPFYIVHGFI